MSGGENVASREVEAVLHTHPGVADVAVIGLPDERWGERVAAVVVRRRRRPGDRRGAHRARPRRTSPASRPRATVEFVDELPRNAAGKVLKQQLRDELGARAAGPGPRRRVTRPGPRPGGRAVTRMKSDLIRSRPGAYEIKPASAAAAIPVADGIWLSPGLSNSYLIVTPEGRVVINTGMGFESGHHRGCTTRSTTGRSATSC